MTVLTGVAAEVVVVVVVVVVAGRTGEGEMA